jgi:hypothetical protein
MKTNDSLSLAGSHICIAGLGRWAGFPLVGGLEREIDTELIIRTHSKFRHIAAYKQQATVDKVVS